MTVVGVLLGLMAGPGGLPAAAQEPMAPPLRGVVWQMPDDLEAAWDELFQMWEMGIEAVRTGIIRDSLLLVYADTLGIQFFQELPAAHAPAGALVDTLSYMEAVLDSMFVRAAGHPSARHFGLARYADTSTPEACAYFDALAGRVRQRAEPESRVYYVGAFVENDRCAGAVDFVLLDARNVPSAAGRLRQWAGPTPVGIAALGSWVDDGSLGLRTPHSPASQARYLEQQLTRLFAPDGPAPVAVFVYRWRDVAPEGFASDDPYRRSYGLVGAAGQRRLAAEVVRGIYTGAQRVFAFPLGQEQSEKQPWASMIGWVIILSIAVLYAASPRLRHTLPRYFIAHGFFREAVREGRDVLPGASFLILIAQAFGTGLVWSLFLSAIREDAAFVHLLRLFPDALRSVMIPLAFKPWLSAVLLALLDMSTLGVWVLLLTTWVRQVQPRQTFMLAVWSRWPMLLLMVAAMVASALPAGSILWPSVVLAACWLVLSILALVRIVVDYAVMSRASVNGVAAAFFTSPFVVLVVVLAVLVLLHQAQVVYLVHLATRF